MLSKDEQEKARQIKNSLREGETIVTGNTKYTIEVVSPTGKLILRDNKTGNRYLLNLLKEYKDDQGGI